MSRAQCTTVAGLANELLQRSECDSLRGGNTLRAMRAAAAVVMARDLQWCPPPPQCAAAPQAPTTGVQQGASTDGAAVHPFTQVTDLAVPVPVQHPVATTTRPPLTVSVVPSAPPIVAGPKDLNALVTARFLETGSDDGKKKELHQILPQDRWRYLVLACRARPKLQEAQPHHTILSVLHDHCHPDSPLPLPQPFGALTSWRAPDMVPTMLALEGSQQAYAHQLCARQRAGGMLLTVPNFERALFAPTTSWLVLDLDRHDVVDDLSVARARLACLCAWIDAAPWLRGRLWPLVLLDGSEGRLSDTAAMCAEWLRIDRLTGGTVRFAGPTNAEPNECCWRVVLDSRTSSTHALGQGP